MTMMTQLIVILSLAGILLMLASIAGTISRIHEHLILTRDATEKERGDG